MRRLGLSIFAALTLAVAQVSSAALVVIDTFDTPSGGLPFIGPTTVPTVANTGAGILGTRTFSVSGPLALGDVMSIGGGSLNAFTGDSAIETFLSYTFPVQDFSAGSGIGLDFTMLDGGSASTSTKFDVILTTSTGNLVGAATLNDSASPFSTLIPFATFTGPGSLSNVTAINIALNDGGSPAGGTDFVLTEVTVGALAVSPEPAALAIWSLAGIATLWQVRRRSRSTSRI